MSNQFHQLLAVVSDRVQKATVITKEAIDTFNKRVEHFDGLSRTYEPVDEGGEKIPSESKDIVTTVAQKLLYVQKPIVEAIDVLLSREETNASGNVNTELKIGGKSFGVLSAIALLALEGQLGKVREVYLAIPTLDPNRKYELDEQAGNGYFHTEPEEKNRNVKVATPITLVKATDKHPAQAEMIMRDTFVGTYSTVYKSGRMTPADKSLLLGRIDQAISAVKTARAKANQAEHQNVKVGNDLFAFINGDTVK